MNFPYSKLFSCLMCLGVSSALQAGSFSLYTEGSVSAVQNFAAGVAAEGRDASVGWYNPAALVLLKKAELVGGGIGVNPVARLTGTSKLYQYDPNDDTDPLLYGPYTESFKDLDGAREAIVPNIHFALPAGDRVVYGVSIVSPMGLASNWPGTSAVRYAGTYSNLRVIDFAPEMGGLITEHFAVGAGIDFQWANVNFDNVIGAPAVLPSINPDIPVTEWDTTVQNHGNSFGIGFHAGFLAKWNDDNTRFGFNYLYGVTHDFQGSSQLRGIFADPDFFNNQAYYSLDALYADPVKFPDIMTFSLFQKVNDRVDIMGSVVYTLWSSFQSITLHNIPVASIPMNDIIPQNATAIQNYRNALRLSAGANYRLTEKWELRGGAGWDQTPTNDIDRDVRLPDVNKWALAGGVHWQPSEAWGFDFGYSYLWPAQTAAINKTQVLDSRNWVVIDATGHSYAQLVAVGAKWRM
jgi:long-chain fatty acid transport protein